MTDFVTIAPLQAVPGNRGLRVQWNGRELAVFAAGGTAYVFDGKCPHRGASLGEGFTEDGNLYCPMHGWCFDLETGACADHPEKSVIRYPARIHHEQIQARFPVERKTDTED